jgi:predicted MPP superfamily phosphohydrolase
MLIDAQKKFGWNLLIDSHAYIQESGEQLAIIGVGNWSKITRFPRYGNLTKAYQGINAEISTQILLSHDPTHWDAEVRTKTPNIALTLSGHTHGMQLGIDVSGFRMSPSRLMFEQWADLYRKGEQYIYVNRGFGYSDGFPIRLGILPEITIFTLNAIS